MHAPREDGKDTGKDTGKDNRLKEGLWADLEKGVAEVDAAYREQVVRKSRAMLSRCGLPFLARDLADCWQEVLFVLVLQFRAGRFKREGSLRAWLKCVMWRRVVDRIRRRAVRLHEKAISIERHDGPIVDKDPGDSQGASDALKGHIRTFADGLDPFPRAVLLADVKLYLTQSHTEAGKWPTLQELVDEVHKQIGGTYTAAAIKSQRHRTRKRLVDYLKRRGYHVS